MSGTEWANTNMVVWSKHSTPITISKQGFMVTPEPAGTQHRDKDTLAVNPLKSHNIQLTGWDTNQHPAFYSHSV